MKETARREKIAVLGGGIGALSAVYELAIQQRYDITVYQLGWRLGGKGASGRNLQIANRIEEHGLHVWFGFYENSFNLMRQCYEALQKTPEVTGGEYKPFKNYREAFTGQDTFMFTERFGGKVRDWIMSFPADDDYPGLPRPDGKVTVLPTVWDYFVRLLEVLDGHFSSRLRENLVSRDSSGGSFWTRLLNWIKRLVGIEIEKGEEALVEEALRLARAMEKEVAKHQSHEHEALLSTLGKFKRWLDRVNDELVKGDDNLRRDWMIVDLLVTCLTGMLADGVVTGGFEAINDQDFREWLKKNGADPHTYDGVLIRSLYDIFFAYENGDIERPNVEAGNALRGSLRTMMTYKGHVLFKMNGGMGDVIFAPLYLTLKNLGVKFKFFHRVEHLGLSGDGNLIETVRVVPQVALRDGKPAEDYQPLVNVDGMPCWPYRPDQSQIQQDLRQTEDDPQGVDLESRWADWKDAGPAVTLKVGQDFDHVLLGISLSALPFICGDLIKREGSWAKMVDCVKTVVTQSVQLWFKPDQDSAGGDDRRWGWRVPGGIVGGFYEAFASWGDFDQLQGREQWPPGSEGSVFYSCGVLPDPGIPPVTDHAFPGRQLDRVKLNVRDFLSKYGGGLWPTASAPDGRLEYDKLTDLAADQGDARLNAQFFRVNVFPSERYVLSLKGTSVARLKAGHSGFDNLTLAGTWIDNGFNLSCIEAAVMSGMQASRAVSGKPQRIVGEPRQ